MCRINSIRHTFQTRSDTIVSASMPPVLYPTSLTLGPSSCLLAADAANTSDHLSYLPEESIRLVSNRVRIIFPIIDLSFCFWFLIFIFRDRSSLGDFPVIGWFCWRTIFFIVLRSCVISHGSVGLILGIRFFNCCFSCEIAQKCHPPCL